MKRRITNASANGIEHVSDLRCEFAARWQEVGTPDEGVSI